MLERCDHIIKAPLKRQEQSETDQNQVTFKRKWTLRPSMKLVLEMPITLYWTTVSFTATMNMQKLPRLVL